MRGFWWMTDRIAHLMFRSSQSRTNCSHSWIAIEVARSAMCRSLLLLSGPAPSVSSLLSLCSEFQFEPQEFVPSRSPRLLMRVLWNECGVEALCGRMSTFHLKVHS